MGLYAGRARPASSCPLSFRVSATAFTFSFLRFFPFSVVSAWPVVLFVSVEPLDGSTAAAPFPGESSGDLTGALTGDFSGDFAGVVVPSSSTGLSRTGVRPVLGLRANIRSASSYAGGLNTLVSYRALGGPRSHPATDMGPAKKLSPRPPAPLGVELPLEAELP